MLTRKQKFRLSTLLFFSFACLLPIITVILFPRQTLYVTKISDIFAVFCILMPFFTIWQWRIGGQNAKPVLPIWQWFLAIILAEIGLISLFLIQNNVLLTALIQTGNISPSNDLAQQVLLPALFLNYGLFPWTLFAIVAIYFSYWGYTKNPYSTFSAHLFSKTKTFTVDFMKRIIDVYIQYNSKMFLLLTVTFLTLQISLFFYPTTNLFTPLYSILISSALFIIFYTKTLQNALLRLEKRKVRQGIHLIAILAISILVTLVMLLMTQIPDKLINFFNELSVPFSHIKHPETSLALWNWSFWILATPLFCSLLIKFSHGRTVKQFFIAVLILPASLLLAYHYHMKDWIHQGLSLIYSPQWIYLPLIITLVLFIYFLLDKNLHTYIWLGFTPVKKARKTHRASPILLWGLSIIVTGTTLVLHLTGVSLISMIGAPCLLIFLALLLPFQKTGGRHPHRVSDPK